MFVMLVACGLERRVEISFETGRIGSISVGGQLGKGGRETFEVEGSSWELDRGLEQRLAFQH